MANSNYTRIYHFPTPTVALFRISAPYSRSTLITNDYELVRSMQLASVRHNEILLHFSTCIPRHPFLSTTMAPTFEPYPTLIHHTLNSLPVNCNARSKSPQNNHLVFSFNPSFLQSLTFSGNSGTRSLRLKSCASTTNTSGVASSSWIFRTVSIAASWSEKSTLFATSKKGTVGF